MLGFHTFIDCDQNVPFMGKSETFWWNNFINAGGNILTALGDIERNGLLKSYVFLNLSNICIYCKVLKSVTVNCGKNCNHLYESC